MNLSEQKHGILIGISLTIIVLYLFGFFSPSLPPPKQIQEQTEQTRLDKLLDEPLGLYAGARPDKSKRSKESGKQWGVALRKMMKGEVSGRKVMTDSNTTNQQAKKTENKKDKEDKKTDENDDNKDDENVEYTDDSYYADTTKKQKDGTEDLGVAGISGGFVLPYTGSAGHDDPQTLDTVDEWIAYFIDANSLSSTDKLVNAKRSKEISEELFYLVVEELMVNFREKLKRYGIIVLNKTPSLESFHRLVRISESNSYDQDVQNSIENALQQYSSINHIQVLIDAINSQEEDNTKLKAIEVSVRSAQINLRGDQNNPTTQEGQQPPHFDRKRIIYGSLKITLENVAQKDSSQRVRQQAEDAARIIGDLLQPQGLISQASQPL